MPSFMTTIISSILPLFGASAPRHPVTLPPVDEEQLLEDIRGRMLVMADPGVGEQNVALVRRIRYAADIHALWFIRSELMAAMARTDGEALARERLERLSEAFGQVLPVALRSRPSRLGGGPREEGPHSRPW